MIWTFAMLLDSWVGLNTPWEIRPWFTSFDWVTFFFVPLLRAILFPRLIDEISPKLFLAIFEAELHIDFQILLSLHNSIIVELYSG